jgi:hypothetical protein
MAEAEAILAVGAVLLAGVIPFVWWLARHVQLTWRPERAAWVAVQATVVPRVGSRGPVAGGPRAVGSGPRVVPGEVVSEKVER